MAARDRSILLFGYHNHNWEFEKADGRPLYDVLLERTDPSLVKMEMDLEQEEYAHSAFESVQIGYDYLAKLDY